MRPGDEGFGIASDEGVGRTARVVDDEAISLTPLEDGAYDLFYAGLSEALDTGGAPPVDPRDALAALRVIEAARRSAADGAVIAMEEET